MSRKGNCYDNAVMESFWATLKSECFHDQIPLNRDHAQALLFDYIETFYNPKRLKKLRATCLHWSLKSNFSPQNWQLLLS